MRVPTLAFPMCHTHTDVCSRASLTAAEVDRLRTAALRVRWHVSSLPFSGGGERPSSARRAVPGAPELPRHGSAVGRWHGARTAWAEDRVTVCTHAVGAPDVHICVGNVAFPTTEESLRHLFEPYGAVDTVWIMTDHATGHSRGFGVVAMPHGTAARAAMAGLQGHERDG